MAGTGLGRQKGRRPGRDGLGIGLLAWCLVGFGLRFLGLNLKPAWSDEWATLVFSLGHSFRSVPLDQLISLETLLGPAQLDGAGITQVVQSLMSESTHPPLYFVLSHGWIHLWQRMGEQVDLGVARSLSALFGIVTIPAAYVLAQVTTRSRAIARTAAALMAVSPFGIYLAQDARHYTLAMLFSMVSMGCFVQAWRSLHRQSENALSLTTVALWVTANLLGLATHYFVGLLLLAQVTVLVGRGLWLGLRGSWLRESWWQEKRGWQKGSPIAIAIGLTLLGALPWGIFLIRIPDDSLTSWIQRDPSALGLWGPPLRLFVALGSMVVMPAVEKVPVGVAIATSVLVLVAVFWLGVQLWQGRQRKPQAQTGLNQTPVNQTAANQTAASQTPASQMVANQAAANQVAASPIHSSVSALAALLVAELAWILWATYGFGRDLSLGSRYLFGLLPVVGLLVAIVAQRSYRPRRFRRLLVLLGIMGSLFVTADVAYSKPDQSRLLVQDIQSAYQRDGQRDGQRNGQSPSIVIGAVYKTHEQVSEMMSLAYEWQRMVPRRGDGMGAELVPDPLFVLAQRRTANQLATHAFLPNMMDVARPADLWLVNFAANLDFAAIGCDSNLVEKVSVNGYRAKHYVCPVLEAP